VEEANSRRLAHPFRHPVPLGLEAISLDDISARRLTIGIVAWS
jgi:hypothetical protein